MNDIRCDIALLPVSGTYVMNADEAVEAASRLGAAITIPMHYDDIIGTGKDAERLQKGHPGEVVIL
jgi:L-ascorbate metabolism protein UlaG (beta-lactamase superfamily)